MKDRDRDLWARAITDVIPLSCNRQRKELPKRKRFIRDDPEPRRIDLHGLTVHDAHRETRRFLDDSRARGIRDVTIITGRSGGIRDEFERWMDAAGVRRVEPLRNGGSYRVRLR